ncbi:MAG: tRNA pseudouridine(55) synthase TruB [Alphaproteobacteria bacterium]
MARRKKGQPVHGWVALDKPKGMTSTQAVARVRRLFDAQKAGHAGTLDPLATGILPIALGEATKTVPFVMDRDKVYRFIIRWGEARTTDDAEGEVTQTSDVRPSEDAVRDALPSFVGEIWQTPPKFSAIKIDGERAYDIAREGGEVEIEPRLVEIYEAHYLGAKDADHTELEITCGKGTYVRSLARDLAQMLGTCGHVAELRRTRVGPFEEKSAISLEKLEALGDSPRHLESLFPVETVLDDIPALAVSGDQAARLRQGRSVIVRPQAFLAEPGPHGAIALGAVAEPEDDEPDIAYAMERGRLVALGQIVAGEFHPTRVFRI